MATNFHLQKVPTNASSASKRGNDVSSIGGSTSASNGNGNSAGCVGRIRAEWKHPPFHSNDAVTNQLLHGPASVGPSGTWIWLVKSIVLFWTISVLVKGVLANDPPVFFLVYLTNWSLVMTCLYLVTSWYHTLQYTVICRRSGTTTKADSTTNANAPTLFHKLTWGLFALAAPAEVVVTIGYWALEWDRHMGSLNYRNIMVHGGVLLLLLFEGLIINRIPVRLQHFGFLMAYLVLYMIWTIVHALLEIGNPYTDGDDDNLYAVLDWKDDPYVTAQYAGLFLFFLAPLAFLTVWCLSLYSPPCGCCSGANRRYADSSGTYDAATGYVEMNTVFSKV